jgi:hypothetical protein
MNERLHRVLDGEISAAELSPAERAELAEYEAAIDASLRQAVLSEPAPRDVSGRVMWRLCRMERDRLDATPGERLAGAARWLLTPRRF